MRGAYDMIASLMGECSPLHMPTKLEILPRVGRPIAVSSSRCACDTEASCPRRHTGSTPGRWDTMPPIPTSSDSCRGRPAGTGRFEPAMLVVKEILANLPSCANRARVTVGCHDATKPGSQ
jgi:hypothetical protein